jgi:hypothetical protein
MKKALQQGRIQEGSKTFHILDCLSFVPRCSAGARHFSFKLNISYRFCQAIVYASRPYCHTAVEVEALGDEKLRRFLGINARTDELEKHQDSPVKVPSASEPVSGDGGWRWGMRDNLEFNSREWKERKRK